jgi:molybdate transport system permease protein
VLSDAEREALFLSFRIASAGVALALPFAVAVAWLLARVRFPGKTLVDGIVHLPLVLPPVVIGYLLLITFGARAPVGGWLLETFGIRLVFDWKGAALAVAVVTFPFTVRAVRLSLEAADPDLETAARTLRAGPWDVFATITLPQMLPGMIAGAITAFAAGLGEFGAIITFVSNVPGETRTLPLAIFTAIQTPGGETAALRLAMLSIALALAGLALSEVAARRIRRAQGR